MCGCATLHVLLLEPVRRHVDRRHARDRSRGPTRGPTQTTAPMPTTQRLGPRVNKRDGGALQGESLPPGEDGVMCGSSSAVEDDVRERQLPTQPLEHPEGRGERWRCVVLVAGMGQAD